MLEQARRRLGVRVDVDKRVLDRRADARACGEVERPARLLGLEDARDEAFVADIALE